MDKQEARTILKAELSLFRAKSYEELSQLVGADPHVSSVRTEAGKKYQMEITTLWDAQPGGYVRVLGSIHNRGWRAFFPLTESFLKNSAGEFGE
jgi:hypothetical protein